MGIADIELTANGFLANIEDWNEDIAKEMAAADGIPELTERHWATSTSTMVATSRTSAT